MAELLFSGWGGEDDEDAAEHPLHPPELQDAPSSISTPAVLSVTATKRRDKLDASRVGVWIDYACIEQDNDEEMQNGIDSLIAYVLVCARVCVHGYVCV